jgi:predicted glycoside hydrolase/deacetylase ChbG (UPF0249 family)
MTRTLIVNGDDFGRTRGVSAGIVHAHLHGLVTTTTAMVNLPGALQDVAQALQQAPTLGLGVHLNLTCGRPVLDPAAIPSLVTPQGSFCSPDALIATGRVPDLIHVEREWRAQVEAFLKTGAQLDHIDSHHHAALFSPEMWQLCLDLAAEFECGVRPPAPRDARDDILFSRFPRDARRFATGSAWHMLQERAIPSPEQLVTRFHARDARLPTLLSILESIPHGTTELMCHPGWVDGILLHESGYVQERETELQALTSSRAIQLATQRGIVRSTFRQAFAQ